MDIDLVPGNYVLAVSGGVDSVALLDIVHRKSQMDGSGKWKLTIAHFDHGIRPDSAEDRKLVRALARHYRLPFVYSEGRLGPKTSEATARTARYGFLGQVKTASAAQAVITAHQQDDVLETAILNLLRGTGRRGLTSLSSRHDLIRPLLAVPKPTLIDYARDNQLVWREDSTNQDETYLRNYIRHRLLPRFNQPAREYLLSIIGNVQDINRELDGLLTNQLHMQSVAGTIDRRWFNRLPHVLARELMATWLRAHGETGFDSRLLERLVIDAKVARAGSAFSLSRNHCLRVGQDFLALEGIER